MLGTSRHSIPNAPHATLLAAWVKIDSSGMGMARLEQFAIKDAMPCMATERKSKLG